MANSLAGPGKTKSSGQLLALTAKLQESGELEKMLSQNPKLKEHLVSAANAMAGRGGRYEKEIKTIRKVLPTELGGFKISKKLDGEEKVEENVQKIRQDVTDRTIEKEGIDKMSKDEIEERLNIKIKGKVDMEDVKNEFAAQVMNLEKTLSSPKNIEALGIGGVKKLTNSMAGRVASRYANPAAIIKIRELLGNKDWNTFNEGKNGIGTLSAEELFEANPDMFRAYVSNSALHNVESRAMGELRINERGKRDASGFLEKRKEKKEGTLNFAVEEISQKQKRLKDLKGLSFTSGKEQQEKASLLKEIPLAIKKLKEIKKQESDSLLREAKELGITAKKITERAPNIKLKDSFNKENLLTKEEIKKPAKDFADLLGIDDKASKLAAQEYLMRSNWSEKELKAMEATRQLIKELKTRPDSLPKIDRKRNQKKAKTLVSSINARTSKLESHTEKKQQFFAKIKKVVPKTLGIDPSWSPEMKNEMTELIGEQKNLSTEMKALSKEKKELKTLLSKIEKKKNP